MKYFLLFLFSTTTYSCKLTGQITKKQINDFLNDTAVRSGHVGISIYDPATEKYLYNYNEEKNFIPSSNLKLFTMYAGMKYLGDSLVGMRYGINISYNDTIVAFQPTGDPTFLHSYFKNQPVYNFLKNHSDHLSIYKDFNFRTTALGKGWAWEDYNEDYMAERSAFPISGNVVTFSVQSDTIHAVPELFNLPQYSSLSYWNKYNLKKGFKIWVNKDKNYFQTMYSPSGSELPIISKVPFNTSDKYNSFIIQLLENILAKKIIGRTEVTDIAHPPLLAKIIHSQPTDSLLRPMMHNSDNFFAEQTLLMVSNEKLGYMSDEDIIDTLLKTDFKDLPTKPRWVDGSGLSRYNLFSPKDFVFLLDKMKNEFGMERIKNILPTGGQGTLKGYYENAKGFIYAKTGSMSNNVSLSGYLFTKKNKMLIFSVQINSFSGTGRAGRRAIEKMLLQVRENN
jgi:serine-type D-Ala-D-Ala carboxypeptidase/endopeptidase (penicillin-binding protein 4)